MIYKYAFNYYRLIFRRLVSLFSLLCFVLKIQLCFLVELLCAVFCCALHCFLCYFLVLCVYPLHMPYNLLVVPKIN